MEVFEHLKWPITALIGLVLVILLIKKPIIEIIAKIRNIKYGGVEAQVGQEGSTNEIAKQPLVQVPTQIINKALGIFSESTLQRAREVVVKESHIEEVDGDANKNETLIKYAQALNIIISFERTYNLIWGSQMYILDYINSAARTEEEILPFYENAKNRYPEVFDAYPFDEYIKFLISQGLLILEDSIYKITWLGRDFLKFLIETGRPQHKKY